MYLPSKDRSFWQAPEGSGLPLSYLAWGRRDFSGERIPVSRHDGWVCVLIEEGQPVLRMEKEKIKLSPGCLVLMGPDCAFGWEGVREMDCKFCLWMWANLSLRTSPDVKREDFSLRTLSRRKMQPFRLLHDLCRREVLDFNNQSGQYLQGCRMQLEVLLERTLRAQPEADTASERVKLAIAWMKEHLDSREPVARLCDYLNISQSSLHRLFKARLQTSPADCFHKLKMDHARELLESGDRQVKEVAFLLGYEHFNDFSRAFKRYYGFTPSEGRGSTVG